MLNAQTGLKWLLPIGILFIPACIAGNPPKPFSFEVVPTEAVAEITEIPDRPVWIRILNSKTENIATIGRTIKLGESIRTEKNALVQITLRTGMVIRMEGDALLSIYGDRKIQLVRGKIVAWVPPNISTKIMLTDAIASVKNATVYIDSTKTQQIMSLQGYIEVLSVDASKPIAIKSGQSLIINKKLTNQPKTLTQTELNEKFNKTKLLSGFNSRIGSQEAIASNLKIPISPTDYIIPPNRPSKNPNKPVNPEKEYSREYYQEPYAYEKSYEEKYERRAEPARSPIRTAPSPQDLAREQLPFTPPPEIVPVIDEPPQPVQPEVTEP